MHDTTMYAAPRIALRTMYDTARRTKDQTTVQTTSQTVRKVIPQAGVSISTTKA